MLYNQLTTRLEKLVLQQNIEMMWEREEREDRHMASVLAMDVNLIQKFKIQTCRCCMYCGLLNVV